MMNWTQHQSRRNIIAIIMNIVAISVVFIVFMLQIEENHKIVLLSWLGILMLLIALESWIILRQEALSPYLILLIIAYIFMYGQCFLWVAGLEARPVDLRNIFIPQQIVIAQVFTLFCLSSFHIGGLLGAYKNKKRHQHIKVNLNDKYLNLAIRTTGWFFFLLSLVPFLIKTLKIVKVAESYGYSMIYKDPDLIQIGVSSAMRSIAGYFSLSLIALLVGYRREATIRSFFLCIILLAILSNFYVGVRGPAFVLIIVLILFWHYYVKAISRRRLLILLIGLFFLISLIPAIYTIRNQPNRNLADYFNSWNLNLKYNTASTLGELGGSMFPLIKTMELVPRFFSFRYGNSYIYAFTTLIPNLGFWEIHPAVYNADLGYWLMDTIKLSYGPGYSWTAEAYINFGWFGILVLFLMGLIYGRIFGTMSRVKLQSRPDLGAVGLMALYLIMMTIRNSFIGTVRSFIYYIFPIYLCIQLAYKYFKAKNFNKKDAYKIICTN